MALKLFWDVPFLTATEINQIDTFVTQTGVTTYPYVNKTVDQVNSTLQYSNIDLMQYNGGFTKTNSDVIFTNAPAAPGLQGVIPGIGALNLTAYDQLSVNGIPNPNIDIAYFYIADFEEINNYFYTPQASAIGISLTFVDNITSVGPTTSWLQLACCNNVGNYLTFQATGTTLYTDQIAGFSTIAASSAVGTNTLLVTSATSLQNYFIPGDFLFINFGNASQEILQLNSISYNLLTFNSNFNYNHYIGETVYSCGRQIAAMMTVPYNFTGGLAQNYYNMSILLQGNKIQRD